MEITEKQYEKLPPKLRALFIQNHNPSRDEVVSAFPSGDSGSAARFFYTAKADAEDRVSECSVCAALFIGQPPCACRDPEDPTKRAKTGGHPTVKPIDLMQYLCRMVTPKGGTILDPFAGSGTTGTAARRENFNAILIEREERFVSFIRHRLERPEEVDMFAL